MREYKCLNQQIFTEECYSLVPIREEDKFDIMKWRNEQLFHLRQTKPLTREDQINYFKNVVSELFNKEYPDQILFSYLENGICIGYGGLVHINWKDMNAEVSFVINSNLQNNYYEHHWCIYSRLLQKISFEELKFHKIYTYAFDLRSFLYPAIEKAGFDFEARLKDHYFYDNEYKDVVIHSIIRN